MTGLYNHGLSSNGTYISGSYVGEISDTYVKAGLPNNISPYLLKDILDRKQEQVSLLSAAPLRSQGMQTGSKDPEEDEDDFDDDEPPAKAKGKRSAPEKLSTVEPRNLKGPIDPDEEMDAKICKDAELVELIRQANELAQNGCYEEAIGTYTDILSKDRKRGTFMLIRLNVGSVFMMSGDLAKAERALKAAVELYDSDPQLPLELATLLYDLARASYKSSNSVTDNVRKMIKEATRLGKDNLVLIKRRVEFFETIGDVNSIIRALEELCESGHGDYETCLMLVKAYGKVEVRGLTEEHKEEYLEKARDVIVMAKKLGEKRTKKERTELEILRKAIIKR